MKTIKYPLNPHKSMVNIFTVLSISLLLISPTSAAMMRTAISGHVANVPTVLQGSGIKVNDPFELFFTFDDSLGVASQVSVNDGQLYTIMTDAFWTGITDWTGSLPTYIASQNTQKIDWGVKESWFRPVDTLHHEEWRVWGLYLITNFRSNPTSSYGWYHYGQSDAISLSINRVVTSPIPEPGTIALIVLGLLGLLNLMRRHRPN